MGQLSFDNSQRDFPVRRAVALTLVGFLLFSVVGGVIGSGIAAAQQGDDGESSTTTGNATVNESASIHFPDQKLKPIKKTEENVLVKLTADVTLPKGGYVTLYRNLSQMSEENSIIGGSTYLKPGTHRNVILTVGNGTLGEDQTIVAVLYTDSAKSVAPHERTRYDEPYRHSNGSVVHEKAMVEVLPPQVTAHKKQERVLTRIGSEGPTVEKTPTNSARMSGGSSGGDGGNGDSGSQDTDVAPSSGGLLGGNPLLLVLVGVVVGVLVVVGLLTVLGRAGIGRRQS